MKFYPVTVLTAASSVLAAPAPRPWCMRPSQPCWKLKRAVEAFHEHAAATTSPTDEHAQIYGRDSSEVSFFASAALDHLESLARQAQFPPEAFFEHHDKRDDRLQCLQTGEDGPCWKVEDEEENEIDKRWCMRPSQPCWKVKRAAESILRAGQEDGDGEAEQDCGDDAACSAAKWHLADLFHAARAISQVL